MHPLLFLKKPTLYCPFWWQEHEVLVRCFIHNKLSHNVNYTTFYTISFVNYRMRQVHPSQGIWYNSFNEWKCRNVELWQWSCANLIYRTSQVKWCKIRRKWRPWKTWRWDNSQGYLRTNLLWSFHSSGKPNSPQSTPVFLILYIFIWQYLILCLVWRS